MPINLRDLLADGKVHVLDGAMGTMLYSKGFFLNVCYDELNLKQPKLVQDVHEAYVRAGAEILETNTFSARRGASSRAGWTDSSWRRFPTWTRSTRRCERCEPCPTSR